MCIRLAPVARTKRLRLWLPAHSLVVNVRNGMDQLSELSAPAYSWNRPELGVLLRMAVPGWPQHYLGRVARGRVFFWFYVVLVLMGLVGLGTTGGTFAFGLALSVHISSILDIFWAGTPDWPSRLTMSAAAIVVVGVAVYFPTYWAASQVMGVRRINIAAGPLNAGDTILFRRGTPDVGDVVVFRIAHEVVARQGGYGDGLNYRMDGEFIDRIIAGSRPNGDLEGPAALGRRATFALAATARSGNSGRLGVFCATGLLWDSPEHSGSQRPIISAAVLANRE